MTDRPKLFTEKILVVNQKAKLLELVNEYKVLDQEGNQIGAVAQVGQSTAKKIARFVSSLDQFMTHTYEIRDADEKAVLVLTRPRKFVKSSFMLTRPDGSEVGQVKQANVFGKIRFSLEAGGQAVGSINAENWRAWNFNIQDATGKEVARITKKWVGLAKAAFTTADNYVIEINEEMEDPLLSLVVAAALCVDTALKQDARGLS
ncbi:MAG: scramblase [Acidimicrobiia bacterium]|nr:scramblase [Acidimicrobiia bacterium]